MSTRGVSPIWILTRGGLRERRRFGSTSRPRESAIGQSTRGRYDPRGSSHRSPIERRNPRRDRYDPRIGRRSNATATTHVGHRIGRRWPSSTRGGLRASRRFRLSTNRPRDSAIGRSTRGRYDPRGSSHRSPMAIVDERRAPVASPASREGDSGRARASDSQRPASVNPEPTSLHHGASFLRYDPCGSSHPSPIERDRREIRDATAMTHVGHRVGRLSNATATTHVHHRVGRRSNATTTTHVHSSRRNRTATAITLTIRDPTARQWVGSPNAFAD